MISLYILDKILNVEYFLIVYDLFFQFLHDVFKSF
jgi:hypothetical protein